MRTTLVFGYGSLLSAEGINRHGLARHYVEDDLTEAWLLGHAREWNAHDVDDADLWLGLRADPGKRCNGVLFEVTAADLQRLLVAEGFFPKKLDIYDLVEVTSRVREYETGAYFTGRWTLPDCEIFTFVTKVPEYDGSPTAEYLDLVRAALVNHGPNFQDDFRATTTGRQDWLRPPKLDAKPAPRRRRGKVPLLHHPVQQARTYQTVVAKLLDHVNEAAKQEVLAHLGPVLAQVDNKVRADAWTDDLERLLDNFKIRARAPLTGKPTREFTNALAVAVASFNQQQWRALLRAAVSVDLFAHEPWLRDQLTSWARQNAEKITSLTDTAVANVAQTVERGVRLGERHEEIGAALAKAHGINLRKAELLARDQVASLNADLTERRQTEVGVKRYVWRTSLDERVRGNPDGLYPKARPSHYAREGKVYSWDDPPHEDDYDGHPGEPPLCRCTAEPVLEDLDDAAAQGGRRGRSMLLPTAALALLPDVGEESALTVEAAAEAAEEEGDE